MDTEKKDRSGNDSLPYWSRCVCRPLLYMKEVVRCVGIVGEKVLLYFWKKQMS